MIAAMPMGLAFGPDRMRLAMVVPFDQCRMTWIVDKALQRFDSAHRSVQRRGIGSRVLAGRAPKVGEVDAALTGVLL